MTISTLLMILTLAVGAGTSQSIESDYNICPAGTRCKIASNCWINGVWYNPCPEPAPEPRPEPTPEILQPI